MTVPTQAPTREDGITDEAIHRVAKVTHSANKAYYETLGDFSQPTWEQAPEWQRESAIAGVQFVLDNPFAPPSAQHNSWSEQKLGDGWVYGEVKDAEAKTHPCLVPYNELPEEQQMKDRLFGTIVRAFFFGFTYTITEPTGLPPVPATLMVVDEAPQTNG